jgi:RNA-directed DNA polymerase
MPTKVRKYPSRILSKTKLLEVWEKARKDGKHSNFPGVDGKSGSDFAKRLDQELSNIAKQIALGQYRFQSLEICWLPKRDSPDKERLICIPTIADRLVQRAIAAYLQNSRKLKISNSVSFGFQKDKDVKSAVQRALNLRNDNLRWVVKTDICAFFDRIPRDKLHVELKRKVPESIFPLLMQVVHCEAMPRTKLDEIKLNNKGIVRGIGLRQGMPLSPMLSNLALREFDEKVINADFKMVRYADDIACFCKTKDEATRVHDTIKQWLGNMGYEIPGIADQTKTKVLKPDEPLEFLGYDIECADSISGYRIAISELVHMRVQKTFKKLTTLATCRAENWKFADVVKALNSKTTAYRNAYGLASNIGELDRRMKTWHRDAVLSLLRELFGESVVTRLSSEKLAFLGLISPE